MQKPTVSVMAADLAFLRASGWTVLALSALQLVLADSGATVEDRSAAAGRLISTQLVIPFYTPNEDQPAVVLRAQQVSKEYQRHGFFRIGLLPIFVLDQVTLDP